MSFTDPDTTENTRPTAFRCVLCGLSVPAPGPDGPQRGHCPSCLSSRHVHDQVGSGASDCEGRMTPISVVVPRDHRWRLVHRCVRCDELSESAVADDDNPLVLMRIAVRPLAEPPFPLELLGEV